LVVACAAAFAALMSASYAGPCSQGIDRVQAQFDAKLEANAAVGPSARESTAATMNRQPTPDSIAAAEAKLGEISPESIQAVEAGMARARDADRVGDQNTSRLWPTCSAFLAGKMLLEPAKSAAEFPAAGRWQTRSRATRPGASPPTSPSCPSCCADQGSINTGIKVQCHRLVPPNRGKDAEANYVRFQHSRRSGIRS
jgi:hypothetical protein